MQKEFAIVFKALEFAAERHKDQKRKGTQKRPYINHPIKVVSILTQHQEMDPALLSAAALHDVIEDTAQSKPEKKRLADIISDYFGKFVADVVLEVSDDKSLSYQERKKLQIIHTPFISDHAKKIKIADKTTNIEDLLTDPPENWPAERKTQYLEWAVKVISGARGVNHSLEKHFDSVIEYAMKELNI